MLTDVRKWLVHVLELLLWIVAVLTLLQVLFGSGVPEFFGIDVIGNIGDLVQKTEQEMLRTPNFGRKSLNEIKEVLQTMALHLGMEIPDWPPENIEEMAKRLEEPY